MPPAQPQTASTTQAAAIEPNAFASESVNEDPNLQIERILSSAERTSLGAKVSRTFAKKPWLAVVKRRVEEEDEDDVISTILGGGNAKRPLRDIVDQKDAAKGEQVGAQIAEIAANVGAKHQAETESTETGSMSDPGSTGGFTNLEGFEGMSYLQGNPGATTGQTGAQASITPNERMTARKELDAQMAKSGGVVGPESVDAVTRLLTQMQDMTTMVNELTRLDPTEINEIWRQYRAYAEGLPDAPQQAEQGQINPYQAIASLLFTQVSRDARQAAQFLAVPFQHAQQRQAQQQAMFDQEYKNTIANAQKVLQGYTDQAENAYQRERDRIEGVRDIATELLDSGEKLLQYQTSRENNAATNATRVSVSEGNNRTRMALEVLRGEVAAQRDRYKDPAAASQRLFTMLTENYGLSREDAYSIAFSAQMQDYFQNMLTAARTQTENAMREPRVQQVQAQTELARARAAIIPQEIEIKRQQAAANIQRINAQIARYDSLNAADRKKLHESYADVAKAAREHMNTMRSTADALRKEASEIRDQLGNVMLDDATKAPLKTRLQQIEGEGGELQVAQAEYAQAQEEYKWAQQNYQDSIGDASDPAEAASLWERATNFAGGAASGGTFQPTQIKSAIQDVECTSNAQCAEGLTQALQNLGFRIPKILGAKATVDWALANGGRYVTTPQPGDIVWVQGPGYGGRQPNGRRSGHHVELYAGNGMVYNREVGRWSHEKVSRHRNGQVMYIRLPR